MVDFVYSVPPWALATLFCGGLVVFALVSLLTVFRLVPYERRHVNNEVADPLGALVGVMFAIIIAFIAVTVWGQYGDAETAVQKEASAAGNVFSAALAYPEPLRTQVRDGMRRYVDLVIKEEWPLQEQGHPHAGTWHVLWDVHAAMLKFEPKTDAEKLVHVEQLRDAVKLMEARRARIHVGHQGISPLVWTVMILGTLLMILFSSFFGIASRRAHLLMTTLVAIAAGLVLFLVATLDYPFRGTMAVDAQAFIDVRRNMDHLTKTPGR